MIRALTLATPRRTLDRSRYGSAELASFERVTGISSTRRTEGTTTELCVRAVKALERKLGGERLRDRIGAIIVVTQSPDRKSPPIAVELQRELECFLSVPAFDVNQACAGFVYGYWLARKLESYVLLVVADRLRALPNTLDNLIFSDAAAAALIYPPAGKSDHATFLTDGRGAEKLCAAADGTLKMDGGAVFDFVTTNMPRLVAQMMEACPEAKLLIQHQPNLGMMKLVEKRSRWSGESLHVVERFGNMSMVSIPSAIAACPPEKLAGKRAILCGYGAGWTAALAVADFHPEFASVVEEFDE